MHDEATKTKFAGLERASSNQRQQAVGQKQLGKAVKADARQTILALLASRATGASLCPSEVARAISLPDDWREAMPIVHSAVDSLVDERVVRLSWKGKALAARVGPYRISRGD